MKKLFAGIITCATILLTGIGVSAAAADENNSGDENVQSEIVFVWNSFDECYVGNTDYPPESYKGFFVEKNGNIRSFSFEDVNEHWTFGYVSMEDIPKTISLNQATPQEKLLSHLTDVSKYQIVGKISEKELERNLNLLSDIDTNVNIKMDISPLDIVQGYSETFGLGYDDNGNAEVVFLNGMGTIINKHTDENALEIDSWLRNLDISSDNPNTETTQPNPTENTTTTTVTTTEVKLNTEPSKNENEQSEIVFCVVNSEQTGRTAYSYGGFFIENNGNVRTFSFENIEENIHKNIQKRLALCYNGLEQYNFLLEQSAPSKILQQYSSRLQQVQQAIQAQQKTRMNDKNMQFQHAAALAASLDPYRVLARGYALVTDTKGKVCTVEQLQPEQPICVRSRQYQARCRVETVEEINESTQKL